MTAAPLCMRLLRLVPLALLAVVAACDSGPGGSLYDPDDPDNAAPVIASVSPEGVVLAGIDEVVLTGENFSATPDENLVFFDDGAGNAARGEVTSASATRLTVKVPNLPNPNLRVRVSVRGASNFSNAMALPLTPAFVPFGDLDAGIVEEPNGIASDAAGVLYSSLTQDGNPLGIKRFLPDGTREDHITSRNNWVDLTLADAGAMFGVFRVQALFFLEPDEPQETVRPVLPSSARLAAVDRGPDGAIWAAGASTSPPGAIYRFDLSGGVVESPFVGSVTDLVVFDGHVYVGGTRGPTEAKVWRLPIGPDGSLGAESVVYDAAADQGPDVQPSSIAVAADGTVFVGLTVRPSAGPVPVEHPVIQVSPAGGTAPLYPGVLPSPIQALTWGAGTELYAVQARRVVEVNGEPNVIPAALFTIETRKERPPR